MKKIIFISSMFLFFNTLIAQTCPTASITLFTQAAIDDFATTYPGCTHFDYNIDIDDGPGVITSLAGLSQIESIQGSLQIRFHPELTNLNGLENLTYIGGRLNLSDNANLNSISSLSNLSSELYQLRLVNNPMLMSLDGLQNIPCTSSYLSVSGNHSLTTLNGLEGITYVLGHLNVNDNDLLTSLTGLENLSTMGHLDVTNNASLTTLEALESVSEFTDLNSFVEINNNPNLTLCSLSALCDYLNANGNWIIFNNGIGCNITEIQDECANCPIVKVIDENENYNGNTATESSQISLKAYNQILNGANVIYSAGEKITLEPGFEATNSDFEAKTDGCN